MKPNSRGYLALVLALLLVVTGQGLAVARGLPGPAGQMVICTGTGPVMISVDENGQPSGSAHFCPEAGQSLLYAHFSPPLQPSLEEYRVSASPYPQATHRAGLTLSAPQARGPPRRT